MPIQLRTDTSAAEHKLRKSWPFAPNPVHFADCTRFLGRWPLQYIRGAARGGQDRPYGCLRDRVPASSGEPVLRAAEAAGQNRPNVAGKEAHGSAVRREHGGEFQAPGDDRSDVAAKIVLNN